MLSPCCRPPPLPPPPGSQTVANRWCENRDIAVAEMLQALDSGGRTAQVG